MSWQNYGIPKRIKKQNYVCTHESTFWAQFGNDVFVKQIDEQRNASKHSTYNCYYEIENFGFLHGKYSFGWVFFYFIFHRNYGGNVT